MNEPSLFENEESKNLDIVKDENLEHEGSEEEIDYELALVVDKRERDDAFKENTEKLVSLYKTII